MNKYMGFYELKSLSIPTVPWKAFTRDTELDDRLLWTVRVALERGNDLNLPRAVGVRADEAREAGNKFLDMLSDGGLVIYYPYFIAEKSGVLDINTHRTVIEACDKDLWNLVTYGRKNVTLILANRSEYSSRMEADESGIKAGTPEQEQELCYDGDKGFLSEEEIGELKSYSTIIARKYRTELSEGRSVLAEWSYAYNTDTGNMPEGMRYLIFYELRDV